MRIVGLFGGSFNPAHGGHRRISLLARSALGLDEVWWLVSPGNPLKPHEGMAPLGARFASAVDQARAAPIRVTAIESRLGTRYTVDTLRALRHRFAHIRFVWLMGSDNLAQFHRWKDWRIIARTMPIAVIARPGTSAATAPAMAWLRPRLVAARQLSTSDPPAAALLRFAPDPRSATAIRRTDPDWAKRYAKTKLHDRITHRPI